jgi:hypothetical protein
MWSSRFFLHEQRGPPFCWLAAHRTDRILPSWRLHFALVARLFTENEVLVVHFLYRKIFQMRSVVHFQNIYRGGQRGILRDGRY